MILIISAGTAVTALADAPAPAAAATEPTPPPSIDSLVEQLANDDYRVREAATRQLLQLGPDIIPALQARLENEPDAEARFRLRFILENVRPPQNGALVVRADPDTGLKAGDLITHVDNYRVRSRAELMRRLSDLRGGAMLRVRGAAGPFETLYKATGALPVICDYRAPEGEVIAGALRLYDAGYAERASELLQTLGGAVPESELSPLLHAIIAYTAGDAVTAFQILAEHPDACEPVAAAYSWTSPSALDLAGPGDAPYHLEWRLWNENAQRDPRIDRDTPIQRVLIPAGRFVDALNRVAAMWWTESLPQLGREADEDRVGGNLLAVSSWMLSELDLVSECLRLIEPRSIILRQSPQGVRKWVRVRTDAWLAFVHGDRQAALDGFYEDARAILQPPGPPANRVHIQNPQVAASIAFFLYQFPRDERVPELFALVNQPDYAPLPLCAYWMLLALNPENFAIEREHMLAMLPNAPDAEAGGYALATALLEYVRERPDADIFGAARARLADAPAGSDKQAAGALIAALEYLSAGNVDEAGRALDAAAGQPGVSILRSTAEFLAATAAVPPEDPAIERPLLAVPLGTAGGEWLILTRARQFVRYNQKTGEVQPVAAPGPNWFPGPLNWPWVGREDSFGRVWIYSLRRITEATDPAAPPHNAPSLRLNIRTQDIRAFDRDVRPVFSALAELASHEPVPAGEAGEFWREDLQAGQEYFADPALPEIGFIHALPPDERIVQVALRGGPHLLIDTADGRSWSSDWIAAQLGLAAAPRFLAQAVRRADVDEDETRQNLAARPAKEPSDAPEAPALPAGQTAPVAAAASVLYLFSDAGLLRFDLAHGEVRRLELPGPEPYPALIPESCPYERRDPRWIYCARLPEAGGQVYRAALAHDHVEMLEMVNESVPREYYLMQSRGELRRQLDALFAAGGLPPLHEFIRGTEQALARYPEVQRP